MQKISFQEIILRLQQYWANYGCVIIQPYDVEVGAGTSHPATLIKALGNKSWNCAYVQPCRRPTDGRYGDNPNRTQLYYQFQVFLKPAPRNSQELYLNSLKALGLNLNRHDVRFVEDDWENPSLGASGLGWEVWCDGMEITQFTYFQQVGGIACDLVPVELTYGLERIASIIQDVDSHFDINWNGKDDPETKITYGDVFKLNEKQFSHYNFELANIEFLEAQFLQAQKQFEQLLDERILLPAYEQCLKANHLFNMLNARGVISVTQRASYMATIRSMTKNCCEAFLEHEKNYI